MKILAIRGENLASLARPFAIDLEHGPLANVGLFAITGPVGAGKSTLLDALCLPLFDRTPRLTGKSTVKVGDATTEPSHWLGERDPRTLLRREAQDGRAEVDFRGRDGVRYRAAWSVRRARRGSGRLQQQEMSLRDLDRDVVIAGGSRTEVLAAIQVRLGLDFAQFCRSVLLAQGEFAAFLRARPDERARLLETLTGADVYRRLSKAAHERARASAHAVELLRSQMDAHASLPIEQREGLEATLQATNGELEVCKVATTLATAYVNWHHAAEQHRRRESEATVALQQAVRASDAAEPRRERSQRLQRAMQAVPRWEVAAQAQDVAERARQELAAAMRAAQTATAGHDAAAATFAAAFAKFGSPTSVPGLVRDLPQWEPLLRQWQAAVAALAAAAARIPELEREVTAAAAEVQVLAKALPPTAARAAKAAASVEAAQAAVRAFDGEALARRRRALAGERRTAERVQALVQAWQAAADTLAAAQAAAAVATTQQSVLAKARGDAATATAQAVLRAEALQTKAGLAPLRARLVDGEPCPLCGSEAHPAAGHADDGELPVAVATLAQCRAREAAAIGAAARADANFGAALEARRVGAERSTAAHAALLAFGGFAEAAEPAAIVAQSAERLAACEAAETVLASDEQAAHAHVEALQVALAEARDALKATEAAVARHRAAEQGCAEARSRLEVAQRDAATAQQRQRDGEAGLAGACEGLADGVAGLRLLGAETGAATMLRSLHGKHQALAAAAQALAVAGAASLAATATADRTQREAAHSAQALAKALAVANVTIEDVVAAAQLGLDALGDEAQALQQLAAEVVRCRTIVQERAEQRKAHEDRDRPSLDAADAEQALRDARAHHDLVEARGQDVRSRLFADDQIRKHRAELQPLLHAAERATSTWLALDELIGSSGGDKFARFAQEMTLDLLLLEANRRLAELARRYRLRRNLDGELDFVVVDLDLGESQRSVWTLSGGETFLVSLALALALATLAAPKSRVETLFLDEGFGTLDAQALETALGALDSLQALGCQVGVISHVDGIAERIGAQVVVQPEGGGKSRVFAQAR